MKLNAKHDTSRDRRGSILTGDHGFTLLEVIMAISILTIGLLAVASMQASAIKGNAISREYTESTERAQDVIEKLLSFNINAPELSAGDHTEDELGLDTTDKYSVTWSVTDDTPVTNVKTILITVQYQVRGSQKAHAFRILRNRI